MIRPRYIGAHDQSVCSMKVGVQNFFLWDHVGSEFTKTVGKFKKKACFSNWSLKTYRRTRFHENVSLSQLQQLLAKSPETTQQVPTSASKAWPASRCTAQRLFEFTVIRRLSPGRGEILVFHFIFKDVWSILAFIWTALTFKGDVCEGFQGLKLCLCFGTEKLQCKYLNPESPRVTTTNGNPTTCGTDVSPKPAVEFKSQFLMSLARTWEITLPKPENSCLYHCVSW